MGGAVSHEISAAGGDTSHSRQQSRLDIGDMTNLEADRRLEWKRLAHLRTAGRDLPAGGTPDLILLDMPLIMGRDVYAQSLADQDPEMDKELKDEIQNLRDRVENFWSRHLDRCFPFAETGPLIVSLGRRRFGSLLRLLEDQGQAATPDPIDFDTQRLIQDDWVQILSIGIDRVLAGILPAEHRTAAFNRQASVDARAFPKSLIEKGSLGFHYLTGVRGEPVQVETLGDAQTWHTRGADTTLDRLAGDLIALTYFDHRKSLPLPLWYAQRTVEVVKNKKWLEFLSAAHSEGDAGGTGGANWLSGWEEE